MTVTHAIYVRSSKCAGASIKSALRSRSYCTYTFNQHFYSRYKFRTGPDERVVYTILHGQVAHVQRQLAEVFEASWKFAIVRNPWDRAVSAYFYCRRLGQIPREVSFKDYLRRDFSQMSRFVLVHSRPLSEILAGPGGCRYLDFIGRFENLQAGFNHICRVLGIAQTSLPHRHGTNHKPYWEYYDRESIELVKRKYAEDIRCFGYEFGNGQGH